MSTRKHDRAGRSVCAMVVCGREPRKLKNKKPKTNDPIRTEGENLKAPRSVRAESIRVRSYFTSSVSSFVAVVVASELAAAISGEVTGCSVTVPSPPATFSFPFWCSLEESANRCLRASSSKASSSVASPQFLQHPRCVDPAVCPGFPIP